MTGIGHRVMPIRYIEVIALDRKAPIQIQTISYIPLAPDKSVMACLDDMTPEQREYIGTALTVKLLNAQFAGRVEFWSDLPSLEDMFPQSGEHQAV